MTRVHVAKVGAEGRTASRGTVAQRSAAKSAFAPRGWGASVEGWPAAAPATAARANRTGLPDRLKDGVEALARRSLDGVRVHYDSARPAQLGALAFAQGREIHLGPGQERHLPHEAWHVVQQAQGRVKATGQLRVGDRRFQANMNEALENEADVYGSKAARWNGGATAGATSATAVPAPSATAVPAVVQGAVVQGKWIKARVGDNNYYWESVPSDRPGDEQNGPPDGGNRVDHPSFQSLPDTAQGSGGDMRSLRTQPDHPNARMDDLTFEMEQMVGNRGRWSDAPTERGGLSDRSVLPSHPPRTGAYRSNFHSATGHQSAAEYEQAQGTPYQGQPLEILHAHANSLAGPDSDDPVNLGTGTFGANSTMIPVDNAVLGRPDIINQTHHNREPGTMVSRTINHQFANRYAPHIPIHQETIDAHRPTPTRTEWDQRTEMGRQVLQRNDEMTAASSMVDIHEELTGASDLMNLDED
jgi:hypothetical protein